VRCPVCGDRNVDKYDRPVVAQRKRLSKTRPENKENKRLWFYICRNSDCRNQFSPTSGTIFHNTHLPLIVWFQAIALMLNAKKGISALQLQRDLGIGGYKTAWYLNHRIREAMASGDIPKMGGIVEIDETYIGGKQKGHVGKKKNKETVVGIRERGGHLRLIHSDDASSKTLAKHIKANVDPNVKMIMTDEFPAYPIALNAAGITSLKHSTIRHKDKIYVQGMVHTNTIESAFSLLKRGIIGSFHRVSIKHLQRYLDEFSYRFNRRNDNGAFMETVCRMAGFKPLTFATLTSEASEDAPF
jgi:transposase-like protein